MIDHEVQEILQEQFSKEKNYQRILINVNKRQKLYKKISKIILLPSCAAIFALIIILNIHNKQNTFNLDIAKTKTTQNRIVTDQNNNSTSTEKKYYKIEKNTSEASWAVDPTDLEKVINLHQKIKISIVRIRVTEVKDSIFLPKMKNFYDPWHPKTPIKVELIETFKGKNTNSQNVYLKDNIIYVAGGDILLADLEKQFDKDEIDKMGISNLSDEIKNSEYMKFWDEYFYMPQIGSEYIIFISPMDNGVYGIVDAGYSIFKSHIENGEEIITNVISKKQYKLKDVLEY